MIKKITLAGRWRSIQHAFAGILHALRHEPNVRIHLMATLLLVVAMIFIPLNTLEIALLLIITATIWAAELFNTSIETIMDHLSPEKQPAVKHIKDMAAGAVLVLSIAAFLIALIIFIPKIIHYVA